jgi:hypothetical protein
MRSVRAAKSSAIAHLTFSALAEPGVVGAAVLAEQAAGLAGSAPSPAPSPAATPAHLCPPLPTAL